jgi:hypothetical protein
MLKRRNSGDLMPLMPRQIVEVDFWDSFAFLQGNFWGFWMGGI